jgi:hypothetical protein
MRPALPCPDHESSWEGYVSISQEQFIYFNFRTSENAQRAMSRPRRRSSFLLLLLTHRVYGIQNAACLRRLLPLVTVL